MKALNIRHERNKRGWTLEYVGQKAGISKSAILATETAQRKPSYDVLCKLEDLFGLPHRQLFTVADDENNLPRK